LLRISSINIAKAQQPGKIANSLSDAAIASGNPYAMVAGLGVKGGMALGRALDIGQGGVEKATAKAEQKKFQNDANDTAVAGAKNINSIPQYQSPLYGRRGLQLRKGPGLRMGGMSFKSKFMKSC